VGAEAVGDPEEGAARLHGGVREAGGRAQEKLRGVPRQVPGAAGSCSFSNNQLRARAQEELRGVPCQVPLPACIPGATGSC
jgi:hypothetical protein